MTEGLGTHIKDFLSRLFHGSTCLSDTSAFYRADYRLSVVVLCGLDWGVGTQEHTEVWAVGLAVYRVLRYLSCIY